jgi:starvation-inducible DNA-binding protein
MAGRAAKATSGNGVVEALERLLADSYTVYLKTHNYHWNVTGPMFNTLHMLFQTEYTELALAVDLIAERIRALGARAPGSYAEFARLSSVEEATGKRSARQMLEDLVADQATLVQQARKLVEVAESAGDQASADLGIRRIDVHEKNAWMLRSHLE